jgi:hypothetical protein
VVVDVAKEDRDLGGTITLADDHALIESALMNHAVFPVIPLRHADRESEKRKVPKLPTPRPFQLLRLKNQARQPAEKMTRRTLPTFRQHVLYQDIQTTGLQTPVLPDI